MADSYRFRKPSPGENWAVVLLVAGLLAFALLAGSCSPRVIENVRYQRDTTYIEKVRVDSTYKRDSVFIREKGDTIFIYKDRLLEKYRFVHDTIRLITLDSIAVERVKEVKVEKPLSLAQRTKISLFWPLFLAALGLGAYTFRQPLLKTLKSIIKI